MRTIQIVSGLLFLGVLAASCTRENPVIDPLPAYTAGKGGKATLNVTPRHHLKDIGQATVYIEYNAFRQPFDGLWDDSAAVVQSNGKLVASFDSLNPGNYFLYAIGFDSDPLVNTDVSGNATFRIVDSAARQPTTYNSYIEVSEVNNSNHQ